MTAAPDAWLVLVAALAGVGVCRVAGVTVGRSLVARPRVRQLLEVLPPCALAAVVGPQVLELDAWGVGALAVAMMFFLGRAGLLAAFAAGVAVLIVPSLLAAG